MRNSIFKHFYSADVILIIIIHLNGIYLYLIRINIYLIEFIEIIYRNESIFTF